ncbi:MAG: FecR domain-containing protein [Bacteroidota bacterium]
MEQPFKDDTLLGRWLSGEISEAERQEVEAHPQFEKWKRLVDATDRLPLPAYDQVTLWDRLQLDKAELKKKIGRRRKFVRLVIASAAATLLLLATPFILDRDDTFTTVIAEKRTESLPDGSSVQLNALTTIKFKEPNWSEARSVRLKGEAFFDVESSAIPFTVTTQMGEVRVLGTSFNVFAREEGFRVSCFEGQVLVVVNSDSVRLVQGQSVKRIGNKLERLAQTNANVPEWMSGETMFINEPLENVWKELERQYDVKVIMTSNPQLFYEGPLPHNNLRQAVEIICNSLGLTPTFGDDKTVRIE